jgi:signal transduction histidine kinase
LLLQILSIGGFFIFLSYFLEKIRRLELARSEYRRLLQDFSKDLIFIKENSVLYEKLVKTIFQAIQPTYCAYYELKGEKFIHAAHEGQFSGPKQMRPPHSLFVSLKSEDSLFSSSLLIQPEIEQGYIFPIKRADNILGLLILGPTDKSIQIPTRDQSIFRTLATQTAIAIENNLYIEETKKLIKKVTEAETREKYVEELENKNEELQNLYFNLKETQTQLIQSEKMASLGQLVAGIAHELNNPIGFVYANMVTLKDYIEVINKLLILIKERIDGKISEENFLNELIKLHKDLELDFIRDDIDDLISDSLKGSQRVKEVVLNLRNFSRLDEADTKNVNIHDGLDSTLLLLTNEIKNRITIHKNYGNLPLVQCKAGQINQVFMNLLVNAIQAIPQKGNIWISTKVSNKNVEIRIKDDGVGIPKSIQNKIFDPFFTTKPVGSGTGLGLSISYKIINEHGGTINIEGDEKKGATFIVTIPLKKL